MGKILDAGLIPFKYEVSDSLTGSRIGKSQRLLPIYGQQG
jgi:hypothetical protein